MPGYALNIMEILFNSALLVGEFHTGWGRVGEIKHKFGTYIRFLILACKKVYIYFTYLTDSETARLSKQLWAAHNSNAFDI